MFALWAGIAAGAIHVWSGPDHLAAVAPLSIRDGKRSWLAGVRWGIGHSAGVILVGIIAALAKSSLHLERFSTWSEKLVGVTLLGIGLWALWRVWDPEEEEEIPSARGLLGLWRTRVHGLPRQNLQNVAFGVGVLHGLAGSSHLLGVLPALALPSPAAFCGYLAGFGMGTIASMAAFSMVIGAASKSSQQRRPAFMRWTYGACSLAALSVGCLWLVSPV